jgi:hypothetical protein
MSFAYPVNKVMAWILFMCSTGTLGILQDFYICNSGQANCDKTETKMMQISSNVFDIGKSIFHGN